MTECNSKLWLVKIISPKELNGKYYCVTEHEYDEIYNTLQVPGTIITVDEKMECVDDCGDSFINIKKYQTKTHYIRGNTMVIDTVEYCPPEYNCELNGLIMCLGLVITQPGQKGMIASHYVTGEDEKEEFKLDRIIKLMQQLNWDWKKGAKMTVYRQFIPKFNIEQKISMEKIQTNLDIPPANFQEILVNTGNIVL